MNNTSKAQVGQAPYSGTAHIRTLPVSAIWTQNRPQDPPAVEEPPADQRWTAGRRVRLGDYWTAGGQQRVIIGQRVDGVVRVSDCPAGGRGRAYLIERELHSKAELDALVADYLARAQLGAVPMTLTAVEIAA